jgi:uncharacterized phage protein (TIGR01671 family)
MQYTGLTDIDGVKIFEGDIVEITETDLDNFNEDNIFQIEVCYEKSDRSVFVSNYKCSFVAYNPKFYMDHTPLHDNLWEYRVIGNIHENPELLKD